MPLVYIPTVPEDDDGEKNSELEKVPSGGRFRLSKVKILAVVIPVVVVLGVSITLFFTCS